ncbi:MAG TPA: endonuclease/exonuclease/phosphatase family protein [Anaerolineales bacterium]|nr:endonuclease/exonuclease/phosphatase family protein [Anaerolineales bacterium]HLB46380.1 endonuclease/exonuclease/phosphatase family protein [Anaerolineales bacterium]
MPHRLLNISAITSIALYDCTLLGLYALRVAAPADGPWWLAFVSVWESWWYLPLPLFMLSGLAIKPRLLAIALLIVPLGLWLRSDGELFLPNLPVAGSRRLTVLTFNLRFDHNDLAAVLAAIHEANADVIALQELTTGMDEFLWPELQAEYPYRLSAAVDASWGSGIYSRYPLTLLEVRAANDGFTDTQDAVLDWNGTPVRLINFHTGPPTLYIRPAFVPSLGLPYNYTADVRHAQIDDLIPRLAAIDSPLVLACDCNMDPASYDYQRIASVLGDSFREAGWGYGHTLYYNDSPNSLGWIPLVRIDYIFHSRHWQAALAQALPYASSNHRPVIAELVMP